MSKNEPLSLEVFDNPEFGQMRILREGDKYLFCANDAAVALGYSNPRAALQRHCKGVAKRDTLTPGGVQSLSYIPEGDLYRLIIHSKLPSAEKFEHWVFEEVLPCIRKTGGYMTDNLLNELMNEPDIIYKVTSDMLKECGQRMRLEGEVKAAKPKVEYFDSFITAEDCTNIRTTTKEIQVPEKQFIAWMLKNKYLYRTANTFAYRQYRLYKLAAGKTAKSILISCGARLAPFDIAELREITAYDELELDTLGDRKTALFLIMSDTDATFNFLISMIYTQLFNLLCEKADDVYGGCLPVHVRCLIDEAANIGQIPNLEKLVATIRSREISACLVLQARSQLKAIYKDNADTIIGNMDSQIFLGGSEPTTLKELNAALGKETIDSFNTSDTRGNSPSYGTNFQKLGHELMSQDELAVLDGGKCILQLRGVRPFLSDKYDLTQHPNFKLTAVESCKICPGCLIL